MEIDINLYKIETANINAVILEGPETISLEAGTNSGFNIVMIDVSGSMSGWWDGLMKNWNEIIAPILNGTTSIYTFGSVVDFRRSGPCLFDSDFASTTTNLTDALRTIDKDVSSSQLKDIRVFLVTDGDHNEDSISPDVIIDEMVPPLQKNVEVFLLGVGNYFPVEYSISIRSKLHTGNSNLPSLFWAKEQPDMEEQISAIANILKMGQIKFKVSIPGYLAPGLNSVDAIHVGEFLYYDMPLEGLSSLFLSLPDHEDLKITRHVKEANLEHFMETVFRQWNSLVIQQHRRKESVNLYVFDVMDAIFQNLLAKLTAPGNNITAPRNNILLRMHKKKLKTLETAFASLMNQSKTIINIEGMYQSELGLAENILKTTVQSKYSLKNLKMKGYGDEDYREDVIDFFKIYEANKDKIMALTDPLPEDCCSVTLGSFVKDLQDENLHKLFEEDKFTLMKTICVTGIPIYAPVKDSSQINPWTLRIQKILVSPFSLVSQTVIELSADVSSVASEEHKDVYLQSGDESSHLNAVVPVFTPEVTYVLKPLLRTNIFAMLSTFCILKNPHIMDMNVHMAALACVWIKTIEKFSKNERPDYIKSRLSLLEATGKIYLDRKGFAIYTDALFSKSKQALMTESTDSFGDFPIKCEALIKPIFFLYLQQEKIKSYEEKKQLVGLIVAEFIGRCLSSRFSDKSVPVYSLLFLKGRHKKDSASKEDDILWLEEQAQKLADQFPVAKSDLLKEYFILEDLWKAAESYARSAATNIMGNNKIELDLKLIEDLYSPSNAGDIKLMHLRKFAEEIGITESDVEEMFSEEKLTEYVTHGLLYRTSKLRMSADIIDHSKAIEIIKNDVESENLYALKKFCIKWVVEKLSNIWREDYLKFHKNVVKPLSQEMIIEAAQARGVQVTATTVSKVFKYNDRTRLIRNACMNEECPYYMIPNRKFNQHLFIGRQSEYLHGLHIITQKVTAEGGGVEGVFSELKSGRSGGLHGRKKPKPPSHEFVASCADVIDRLFGHYNSL